MVLGIFSACMGVLQVWLTVRQGSTLIAEGVVGDLTGYFFLVYRILFFE